MEEQLEVCYKTLNVIEKDRDKTRHKLIIAVEALEKIIHESQPIAPSTKLIWMDKTVNMRIFAQDALAIIREQA